MASFQQNRQILDILQGDMIYYKSLLEINSTLVVRAKKFQLLQDIQRCFLVYNNKVKDNSFPVIYSQEAHVLIANVLIIDRMIEETQRMIFAQNQDQIAQLSSKVLNIVLPFMIAVTALMSTFFALYYKQNQIKYDVINLFQHMKRPVIEGEIRQTELQREQASHKFYSFIKNYHFDLFEEDSKIDKQSTLAQKPSCANNLSSSVRFPHFTVIEKKSYLAILGYILVLYMAMIIQYLDLKKFITRYSKHSELLQTFSNAQVYGNSLCCLREFMYNYLVNAKYLNLIHTRADFEAIFFDYLDKMNKFATETLVADYDFLDSQEFSNLQKKVAGVNLCLKEFDLHKSNAQTCQSVLNGALTYGLPQALGQIVVDMRTEYDITRFNVTLRNPPNPILDQFYASFYTQQTIKKFIDIITNCMVRLTQYQIDKSLLVLLLFIFYTIIINFVFLLIWNNQLKEQHATIQRAIMIIPQSAYITIPQLFSQFKLMIKKYKLI